jgi:MtaA/CmuA family methyltransferase
MNGYQRVKCALEGEWFDKRPVMLHNFMLAAQQAGITMRDYREKPDKAAQAHIIFAEKYDLDAVFIDVDTATLAAALGVPVDYPENDPARGHGVKLNSLEEVDNLQPVDISQNEYVQKWLEICRLVKRHFGDEKYIRGNCDQAAFSLASMLRGSANFMMDLLSGDDRVFKLLDYCTLVCQQFISLMAKTGVHMISNGDSPAGPEMISPEMYKQFAFDYEKRLIEHAHKNNLHYTLHICGDTELILDQMIETGSDALELDYKTDISALSRICKNKITIIGTLDPSAVIANGTVQDVELRTLELLQAFKDTPRFIMNAGCAIPPNTPHENIKKIVELTHSFQG